MRPSCLRADSRSSESMVSLLAQRKMNGLKNYAQLIETFFPACAHSRR